MSAVGAKDWISDLGVRPEGAVYFVLAYKLQSKAMFAITKEEFLQGMKKLRHVNLEH